MKNVIIILALIATACEPQGTVKKLSHEGAPVEVYQYFYSEGSYIYVAKFKDSPETTINWLERHGKSTIQRAAVLAPDSSSTEIIN